MSDQKPEELKPCLHCNKTPELPADWMDLAYTEDLDEFAIRCSPGCGATGPIVELPEGIDDLEDYQNFSLILGELVKAWNRRAEQPKPPIIAPAQGDAPKGFEVLDTSCPKCGWIKQPSDYERGFEAGRTQLAQSDGKPTWEAGSYLPSRPVLRWHGGKWLLAPWIISFFPRHKIYTEVYGGAASVLLRKQRADHEIYNDLDGAVVNLFRILRDPIAAADLRRRLELTPFAREEFKQAYEPTADLMESARRLVIRCYLGFGSNAHSKFARTGFRARSTRSGLGPPGDWHNYPAKLEAVTERLRGVVIENRQACDLLKACDAVNTLHYVDPPYVHSTRKLERQHGRKAYDHEMTDKDHEAMAEVLKGLNGMVILSGYDCPLYKRLFKKWPKLTRKALADGARERLETLWFNPAAWEARPQGSLF